MALPSFMDARYSVVVSYALEDDRRLGYWINCFHKELQLTLRGRLRYTRLAPMLLRGRPLQGDSTMPSKPFFALMVVVADKYVDSGKCLADLKACAEYFDEDERHERVFLVSLSQPALERLRAAPDWASLCNGTEPLVIPFHTSGIRSTPLPMYSDAEDGRGGILAPDFVMQLCELREMLVRKIRRDVSDSSISSHPHLAADAGSFATALSRH